MTTPKVWRRVFIVDIREKAGRRIQAELSQQRGEEVESQMAAADPPSSQEAKRPRDQNTKGPVELYRDQLRCREAEAQTLGVRGLG